MLHQKTTIRMEETCKKEQTGTCVCRDFVVLCGLPRSVPSGTRSNVLHNHACGIIAHNDSNLSCNVFLVVESTIVGFEKKGLTTDRLDTKLRLSFHSCIVLEICLF